MLCALSFGAGAQDKSEYFGQSPAVTAEAVPPAAKRVVISNAPERSDDERANGGRVSGGRERGTGPAPDEAGSSAERLERRPRELSEFQKFVADNTGKVLPVFGTNFFSQAAPSFAPLDNAPVPADYMLGVGDELLIRGWGSIDIDFRAKIDRNGLIAIPTIGSVVMAGVKASDAEAVVRGAVGRLYKGVTVSVNFGKLRAITVYVVGQAKRPGSYTMSSLSTLVTAVFASGGPNASGSMRRVQVRRGAALVAELDMYAFIARGDKAADIKLRDGDTIVIPPAGGYAALTGKVNSPAIYELRGSQDTLESLLEFAGGTPVVADPRRAFIERIDPGKKQPRSVEQFALDSAGLRRSLKNGDVVHITSITPDFSNAVVLRGNVDQPVRAPFRPGMRISDLIPDRQYLLTRNFVKRQNNTVLPPERRAPATAPDGGSRDWLDDGRERPLPGSDDSDSLRGVPGTREAGRERPEEERSIAERVGSMVDEINWEYAVIERFDPATLAINLIPFNLGQVFSAPGGKDNHLLQPGDTVTIFSQDDMAVPVDRRRVFVRVEGEVNAPGVYQMTAGETLQSLLAKSGGPTANAYLFGTAFYREQVRKEQEINLEKAALKLEQQMRAAQSLQTSNRRALTPADAQLAETERQQQLQAARETIARFRQLKPTGRVAFGLNPAEKAFSRLPQMKLQNGDRLVIPARPEFVHVFGAVNAESSPLWRPRGRVGDYLKMVGVTDDADLDNVVILRVDGSVVSKKSGGWFFGGMSGVEIMPGDSIVVPEKLDREGGWSKFTRNTREWAQIFANFGLGAAAIKSLR